jgi:serine/threonine-protein kinase HipA
MSTYSGALGNLDRARAMITELVTLLGEQEVGRVRLDGRGRLSLVYSADWPNQPGTYPLSVTMPLSHPEHGHRVVEAFLRNLLPDDPAVQRRWALKHRVASNDLLGLLAKVGQDCAGAVHFRLPEQSHDPPNPAIEWLETAAVAERLRGLWNDASAWRRASDAGQFTLSGVQPKTALYRDGQRWGIPSGSVPTTHILKIGAIDDNAYPRNEHFCLSLAGALGLPVASSRVEQFDDEVAIAVERFDRIRTGTGIVRIHQEDLCQALAVLPSAKYESDGGPSCRTIVDAIREYSMDPDYDVGNFVAALVYNWLIAGADGHAKNYALRILAGAQVSHAPLFDISSTLPYTKDVGKIELSMAIGGHTKLAEIGPPQWRKLMRDLSLEEEAVKSAMTEMVERTPDLASQLLTRCNAEGLAHPMLDRVAAAISDRARQCRAELRAWPALKS